MSITILTNLIHTNLSIIPVVRLNMDPNQLVFFLSPDDFMRSFNNVYPIYCRVTTLSEKERENDLRWILSGGLLSISPLFNDVVRFETHYQIPHEPLSSTLGVLSQSTRHVKRQLLFDDCLEAKHIVNLMKHDVPTSSLPSPLDKMLPYSVKSYSSIASS